MPVEKSVGDAVTGATIKEALENGMLQFDEPEKDGRFPQVSGLTFTVDRSKPAGERVSDVMANGAPLDEAATYKVATNDYMGNGGDGYSVFKGAKMLVNVESSKLMANDVMAYIRSMGEVTGTGDPRITLK